MRCIFREISKDDFGIDGEIEVVVPKADGKGYETTGGIIKVQAKSGKSYIRHNSNTEFKVSVDKNDLEFWYNTTFPVIFVVYHPNDDKLYWKEIKSFNFVPHLFSGRVLCRRVENKFGNLFD